MGPGHLTPGARAALAAAPFVLAAGLVLLFDVLREIPVTYTCGDEGPPGHDDVIAAYRSGALPLHLLTLGVTLGALVLLGAGRGRGPFGIGWPTLTAIAALAVAVLIALLPIDGIVLVVLLPLLLVDIGIAIVAGTFGARATGTIAALLLAGAAVWAGRAVARGRTTAVRAALWVLVLLTGAHLLLVEMQGDVPGFC